LVRRIAGQRGIQIGKAAHAHAGDGPLRHSRTDLALRQTALQRALVEQSTAAEEPAGLVFSRIRAAVREAAGELPDCDVGCEEFPLGSTEGRPRLTEPWFCCAEPTELQFGPLLN